jgi:hypothetical protein
MFTLPFIAIAGITLVSFRVNHLVATPAAAAALGSVYKVGVVELRQINIELVVMCPRAGCVSQLDLAIRCRLCWLHEHNTVPLVDFLTVSMPAVEAPQSHDTAFKVWARCRV